jgi:hypothetical protein
MLAKNPAFSLGAGFFRFLLARFATFDRDDFRFAIVVLSFGFGRSPESTHVQACDAYPSGISGDFKRSCS